MNNLYDKELNDFCRKYFIKGEQKLTSLDIKLYQSRLNNLKSSLFENFMLFDKTTFKVYGENIPLAVLINELTLEGLERLIEQNSIGFALWTPMLVHLEDNIPGIVPIAAGRLNSGVHSDPEQSIDMTFEFLRKKPNKKQRNLIKDKVRDLYIIPEEGIEDQSTEFTLSAYNSNKFKSFGLSNTFDIYSLNKDQKQLLTKCAEDLVEYKFLISKKMTSSNNSTFSNLFIDTANKINHLNNAEVTSYIANFENFPNIKEVSLSLKNPLKDIPKLREKKNIKKFRAWLNEVVTDHEMSEITKAYIDAISNSKGFFETKKGRFTKNVAMALIGAGVGSAAGPVGTAVGGVLGTMVEPAADFALDMVDEYLISELTKGWTPRMFFDELNKYKSKK